MWGKWTGSSENEGNRLKEEAKYGGMNEGIIGIAGAGKSQFSVFIGFFFDTLKRNKRVTGERDIRRNMQDQSELTDKRIEQAVR